MGGRPAIIILYNIFVTVSHDLKRRYDIYFGHISTYERKAVSSNMMFDNTPLYVVPQGVRTRWASPENMRAEKGRGGQTEGGRKGSAFISLSPGESRTIAEEHGVGGTIRRIWTTMISRTPALLRSVRLDVYWDQCSKPAISAPLGDFFGTGLGLLVPFQSALFSSPEGRSMNCFVPMPFKRGMKVVITNESDGVLNDFYYDIDYTIGDAHGDDVFYLHAHYRREHPTEMQRDYEILPKVTGKGKFLGSNIGVAINGAYYGSWWGEGEVKMYLDGDTDYPTLCGTGTEDYIGTGYGQKQFDHLYQGCHVADDKNAKFCFYRYHIPDPIYFETDIRITIQQLGCWNRKVSALFHYNEDTVYSTTMEKLDFSKAAGLPEYGLYERQDDWSSCAYFYLNRPENDLPAIDDVSKRLP